METKTKIIIGVVVALLLITAIVLSVTLTDTSEPAPLVPVDGSYTEYKNVGTCVKSETDSTPITCGSGKQKQERNYVPGKDGGVEILEKDRELNTYLTCSLPNPCPIDGYYTEYVNEGGCMSTTDVTKPITCGIGLQKRRSDYIKATLGGSDAAAGTKQTTVWEKCVLPDCPKPIDGFYTEYIDTGDCLSDKKDDAESITCGSGFKKQTRIYNKAQYGGKELTTNPTLVNWAECKLEACPPIDGSYTDYVPVGKCVKSETDSTVVKCGNAVQKQIRTYLPPKYGGEDISPELRQLQTYISCELDACPPTQDATCSEWLNDSKGCECSADGKKYQVIQRRIYTPPVNGGADTTDPTCKTLTSRTVLCNSSTANAPYGSTPNGICPVENVYINYPLKDEKLCKPANGPNRKQTVVATYTFPIGTYPHNKYILDGFTAKDIENIQKLTQGNSITLPHIIENVNITFKRINSSYPEQYTLTKELKCDFVPWNTSNELESLWKSTTNCENGLMGHLKPLGKSLLELQNIESNEDIKKLFNRFKASELMKTFNKEDIESCYATKSFLIIDKDGQNNSGVFPTLLPSYVQFSNRKGEVIVLKNGNYTLIFKQNGSLSLTNNNIEVWSILGKDGTDLKFLNNGNLVITDINNAEVAATKTFGNTGSMLHLSINGMLSLINSDKREIVKSLYQPDVGDFISKGAIFSNQYHEVTVMKNDYYKLILQRDGNLVLYDNKKNPTWATSKYGIIFLVMHNDAHLIAYKDKIDANNMIWKSETVNYWDHNLYLTTSGYLIFRNPAKKDDPNAEFVLHPQKEGKINYPSTMIIGTVFRNFDFIKTILRNGKYYLRLQTDGNLILADNERKYWSTDKYGDSAGPSTLIMHDDGHLIQYKGNGLGGSIIWATDTPGNNGGYLHLTNNGYLVMRRGDNSLLKIFYPSKDVWCQSNDDIIKNRIIEHLKTAYYDLAPHTLFTSKKGYVWKATWSELDKKDPGNIFTDGTGNRRNFKGFSRNRGDSQWNIKQINLKNKDGFPDYNDIKPTGEDNGIENYSSVDSIKEWARNCNRKIKPLQLEGGGNLTNYIPGYQRITGLTDENNHNTSSNFLIYYKPDRGDWDLGFILYQRYHDRERFANDVYENNPELIRDLKNHFCDENINKI